MPDSLQHTTDVALTDQERRVIGSALDVTASFHGALGAVDSMRIVQALRLKILGDLLFEDDRG